MPETNRNVFHLIRFCVQNTISRFTTGTLSDGRTYIVAQWTSTLHSSDVIEIDRKEIINNKLIIFL